MTVAERNEGLVSPARSAAGSCLLLAGFVLVWPMVSGGCYLVTTKREGKALARRIDAVEQRLEKLHEREEQVRKSIARSRQEQKKLAELMDQARKVFLRNSADVGAKVERLMTQIGTVLGRLDSLEKDMAAGKAKTQALAKRLDLMRMELATLRTQVVGVLKQLAARAKEPHSAEELFKAGKEKFSLGEYGGAIRYFRKLTKRFPTDKRADEAAFLIGEAYFRQNKFAAAEYSFKMYLRSHPKGAFVVRAWLDRARCYHQLKYCRGALKILGEFLRRFRKGPEVAEARALRLKIRKQLRNIRYCEQ